MHLWRSINKECFISNFVLAFKDKGVLLFAKSVTSNVPSRRKFVATIGWWLHLANYNKWEEAIHIQSQIGSQVNLAIQMDVQPEPEIIVQKKSYNRSLPSVTKTL
jgi:hypothetical protein